MVRKVYLPYISFPLFMLLENYEWQEYFLFRSCFFSIDFFLHTKSIGTKQTHSTSRQDTINSYIVHKQYSCSPPCLPSYLKEQTQWRHPFRLPIPLLPSPLTPFPCLLQCLYKLDSPTFISSFFTGRKEHASESQEARRWGTF